MSEPRIIIEQGDCLDNLALYPDGYFDLVFTSPPYEDARTYNIDFNLKGQDWVDWARVRFVECYRVSKGLVAWIVEGKTRKFRYSATPLLLGADLHRAGVHLRKPPAFHRVGIPGSGGPDFLRNDYEFIVCAAHGKLPWSDNTVMGHECKYGVGGAMSYRTADGRRRNAKTGKRIIGGSVTGRAARLMAEIHDMPYIPPEKANPGNVIHCKVGGGKMGSPLAHENEAPFPERLAEFFVRSFCPPGGIVLDPFCGSGTTLSVAKQHGRNAVGIDIRPCQINLSNRRIAS